MRKPGLISRRSWMSRAMHEVRSRSRNMQTRSTEGCAQSKISRSPGGGAMTSAPDSASFRWSVTSFSMKNTATPLWCYVLCISASGWMTSPSSDVQRRASSFPYHRHFERKPGPHERLLDGVYPEGSIRRISAHPGNSAAGMCTLAQMRTYISRSRSRT